MNSREKGSISFRMKSYIWLFFIVWTCCIVVSLAWNIVQQRDAILSLARMRAELTLKKDIIYRKWVSSKGGVYVPVSTTAPNPYLKVPNRDLATVEGHYLTLVNPEYMTRQVNEMAKEDGFDFGHITSLKPIRPENFPDDWEKEALQAFNKGMKEVYGMDSISGREYFRLIRPFIVETSCLICHAHQGYKAGDISGGISSSIFMPPLYAIERRIQVQLSLAHGVIWMLGIAGIAFAANRFSAQNEQTKSSEKRAKKERDKAERYLNIAAEIILSLDAHGKITLLNDSGHRLLGYESGALIGKNWFETCLPEEVREEVSVYFEKLKQGGIDQSNYESPVMADDGTERFILWRNIVLRDDAGGFIETLSSGEDITDRKQAEEIYRVIFNNATDGILLINLENQKINSANNSMSQMLGYSLEDLKKLSSADIHPEEDLPYVFKQIENQAKDELASAKDLPMKRKDGSVFFANVRGAMIILSGQKYLLGIFRDITERKRAEENIRMLFSERELLLKEVHHRIKNNMTMIASFLWLQASRLPEPGAVKALHESHSRVMSMAAIYDMLFRTTDFRYVSVNEYISQVVDGITASLPAVTGVKIEKRIDDFVLDSKVLFPVGIIINELVTNAYKYAFPEGGTGTITVSVSRLPERNCVEMTVSDDGAGIPENVDINAQSGFGMKLVTMLVHQIEGTFECVRGGGTLFRIIFEYISGEGNNGTATG
jgi:PAS domain S-box-containing protein